MSRHVILGAGPVAHAIVASLTQRGIGQVEASAAMEDAIEERFPEVVLKVVADFLVD